MAPLGKTFCYIEKTLPIPLVRSRRRFGPRTTSPNVKKCEAIISDKKIQFSAFKTRPLQKKK